MIERTASEKIGAYVESVHPDSVSETVVHQVARAFVDSFGCAAAGRNQPSARIARDYALLGGSSGPAILWATGERLHPELAALVNGVMVHALDFDDVTPDHTGHPSAVLLPALVALGETFGATGKQIAAAYAVGFEVTASLPFRLLSDHYSRGWHSTATIGILRTVIACAHLLGLDAERSAAAIGIAVAHAAGLCKSFGTMCKAVQPGNAAAAAVRCALLAKGGFSAPRDSLDGHQGFLEMYAGGEDIHPCLETLGTGAVPPERASMGFKRYPCDAGTHRSVQGILDLIAERPIPVSEIERVRITLQPRGLFAVPHHRPTTGLEGKFSLEYIIATALLDGAIRLDAFTDTAVQRPEAQALLRKVEVFEEAEDELPRRARVEVELRGGERRSIRVVDLRGSAEFPLTDAEVEAKFRDCVAFSRLEIDVDGFLSSVWSWRDRPIRSILEGIWSSR